MIIKSEKFWWNKVNKNDVRRWLMVDQKQKEIRNVVLCLDVVIVYYYCV